jgi:hypothetical protein
MGDFLMGDFLMPNKSSWMISSREIFSWETSWETNLDGRLPFGR